MIRKILKISLFSFITIIILLAISVGILFFSQSRKWKKQYTVSEMKEIASMINNSPAFPHRYYEIHKIIYPDSRTLTINQSIIYGLFEVVKRNGTSGLSPQIKVYRKLDAQKKIRRLDYKNGIRFPGLVFGYGISNYASPEKCFDYINDKYFADSLSFNLFNMPIEELNDSQLLELTLKNNEPYLIKNDFAYRRGYDNYIKRLPAANKQYKK